MSRRNASSHRPMRTTWVATRPFPGGVSAEHRDNVTVWWIEVFGGRASHSELLGGYEAMLAHQRGLTITPAQRHRVRRQP